MAYTYATVDTWLRENEKRMIECPLQPGQLKISKDACTKRYMVAQEEDLEEEIKRKIAACLAIRTMRISGQLDHSPTV